MTAKLFLLRGLPGAGKSTMAKELNCIHLEADMWFISNETGEYQFDPKELGNAHAWCQDACKVALTYGKRVAVSNTFTEEWEMKPYFDMAAKLGVQVFVMTVENYHGGQSVHNVPEVAMERMEKRFSFKLR